MDEASQYLSTAQVAQALGVGVSTVKRWVDEKILPAYKTPGGHRKLLLSDVLRLARAGQFPNLDLSRLSGLCGAETMPESLSRQLADALLVGSEADTRTIIQRAYYGGLSLPQLADQVVGPAMALVGASWEDGTIDVLHEHRATHLILSVLFELRVQVDGQPPTGRPIAVGGSPEDDPTVLNNLLIEMALHDLGWHVINLGPDVPLASLRKAVDEFRPRLVWLSATHMETPELLVRDYPAFYEHARQRQAAVALGGRSLTPELRERLPCDHFGDGITDLATFARSLHATPQRPPRGRPRKQS